MTETAGPVEGYRTALGLILWEAYELLKNGDPTDDEVFFIRRIISRATFVKDCVDNGKTSDALIFMLEVGSYHSLLQVAPEQRSATRMKAHLKSIAASGGSAARKTKIGIDRKDILKSLKDLMSGKGIGKTKAAEELSRMYHGRLSSRQILRYGEDE